MAAVNAVRGENPFAVSKRFGVPHSTVVNKATGVSPMEMKMGPQSTLGKDIEST